MESFDYDSKEYVKEAVDAENRINNGGKFDQLKLNPRENRVLILPPLKGKKFFKEVVSHEQWGNDKKLMHRAACPRVSGLQTNCPVCDFAFEINARYKEYEEGDPKKKELEVYRNLLPKTTVWVNAINLKDDLRPQPLKLPTNAFKLVLSEIRELGSIRTICHLDEGRPLIIQGNGEKGIKVRYDVVKFMSQPVNLLQKGLVSEDAIIDQMYDLDRQEAKVDQKELEGIVKYNLRMLKTKGHIFNSDDSGEEIMDAGPDLTDARPQAKKEEKNQSLEDDFEVDMDDIAF